MRLIDPVDVHRAFECSWFEDLEQELGIAGLQEPLWHIFIDTLEALSDDLKAPAVGAASPMGVLAPSLPELLRIHHGRLAIERMGVRNLIESLDLLYRSLTPRQRRRADRLLRPLFVKIGLGHSIGAPIPLLRLPPTGVPSPVKDLSARAPLPSRRSGAPSNRRNEPKQSMSEERTNVEVGT